MNAHDEASRRVAALFSKPWLRHYVSSKLRSDPVFPAVWEALRGSRKPLLDVGCGVGLLPFYLRERGCDQTIIGLDADERKVREAVRISAGHYTGLGFVAHDVRTPLPEFRGDVALLDVVHYLPPPDQQRLLSELATRVPLNGVLVLRDSPRERSPRFWMTYAGERFAQAISWNLGVPLHFSTRESITAPFAGGDFDIDEQPAYGGTPFNNRLFVFRRRASAAVPVAG